MLTEADIQWMKRALELAERGVGRTSPNPAVGAVVVKRGRLIGEGWHRRAGGPHAEVEALAELGDAARGATLYVTLEPCSTHGRTPPCTDLIISKKIKRVVVAVRDPNPAHSGRGLRILRSHGIEVTEGVCADAGRELLAPFAKWITSGLPFVTLKMGMTLDGRIADGRGNSRWITGAAARAEVRRLRKRSDAIMVGGETARRDNPGLRWSKVAARNPKRVVLDSGGRLPLDSQVFTDGQVRNTIIAVAGGCAQAQIEKYRELGASVWKCGRGHRVSLKLLLKRLGDEGVLNLLCEGGGELAASLIELKLVDRFEFFVAPKLLGGGGRAVTGGSGWKLGREPRLKFTDVRCVGSDVWIRALPIFERSARVRKKSDRK